MSVLLYILYLLAIMNTLVDCENKVSIFGDEVEILCTSKQNPLWQRKTADQSEMQGIAFGTEKLPRFKDPRSVGEHNKWSCK